MARGIVKGGLNDGGSNIKSIQSGTVDIVDLSQTDVTITEVDLTKSIVRITFNGEGQAGALKNLLVSAAFINSATIRIKRGEALGAYAQPIYWEVIEFKNVKSKQSGDVVMALATQDVTVTSVDLSKVMLFYTPWSTSADYNAKNARVGGYLINQTTIRLSGYAPQTYAPNIQWQLIEFS